jgi:hypothetical protein
MVRRAIVASTLLLFVGGLSPGSAHEWRQDWYHDGHGHHHGHWRVVHGAIYQSENRIAFLEADPEIDDGYKAAIIGKTRADVNVLRAALPPPHWRWASPCCYSRRPIHVR